VQGSNMPPSQLENISCFSRLLITTQLASNGKLLQVSILLRSDTASLGNRFPTFRDVVISFSSVVMSEQNNSQSKLLMISSQFW
jgi:hypothetical protein